MTNFHTNHFLVIFACDKMNIVGKMDVYFQFSYIPADISIRNSNLVFNKPTNQKEGLTYLMTTLRSFYVNQII